MRVSTSFRVNGTNRNVSPAFAVCLVMAIFILVGGILGAVGIILSKIDAKKKEECTVPVEAYVISYKYNEDGLASPIYSYEYEGAPYEFSANAYSNDPPYDIGDKADIMIDPDSPHKAYVPADKTISFISILFKCIGFGFVGIGVIVVLVGFFLSHLGKKQAEKDDFSSYGQWQ
ncbi:DUF3592 domain-containing protein [Ruminococcus albus]|uniref:DUF3592 domain-containing protein n=1 Tax=Ruminococcus albus TaxID=1264 RepID=A0A1I1DAN3_RUMAL|nr:DUF3592 domain-containing protein [Ruminococcus albus]SFB71874.1 hypothetical protein SAMN02910406_00319 [Ruminococcus albus]